MRSKHDVFGGLSSGPTAAAVLMLLMSSVAAGQSLQPNSGQALTLSEAIASAVAASPDLVAARAAAAAALGRERQASAIANPAMSFRHERTGSGPLANSQEVIEVEQTLEIGGIRGARTEAARLRREAAEARVRSLRSEVEYTVTVAFAEAVEAERRLALAALIAGSFNEAERAAAERLAAGDIPGFTARRIRLEKNRYSVLHAEAALEHRTARLALLTLLPTKADSSRVLELDVVSMRAATVDFPGDSTAYAVVDARPDIAALALDGRAALADATVARRERRPVPVFAAGAKRETFGDGAAQSGIVAGLRLHLPLWDRRAGAIEASDADARSRNAELASARRQAIREIAESGDALRTAEQQLATMSPQLVEDAAATLRAAQAAYAEGEISLLEWLDASRAYYEVETGLANLRSQYVTRAARLIRARGIIPTPDAR